MIAKEVVKDMETGKAQVRNSTDDINSFEHKKMKEENEKETTYKIEG